MNAIDCLARTAQIWVKVCIFATHTIFKQSIASEVDVSEKASCL